MQLPLNVLPCFSIPASSCSSLNEPRRFISPSYRPGPVPAGGGSTVSRPFSLGARLRERCFQPAPAPWELPGLEPPLPPLCPGPMLSGAWRAASECWPLPEHWPWEVEGGILCGAGQGTLQAWSFPVWPVHPPCCLLSLPVPPLPAPQQLQTHQSEPQCLGVDPHGCEKLSPSPRQAAPLACSFPVSWLVIWASPWECLNVTECLWTMKLRNRRGCSPLPFHPSLHIFVLAIKQGKMSASSRHELFPKKDAVPSVQGCVSPVTSYLFGPILLGAKRNKTLRS